MMVSYSATADSIFSKWDLLGHSASAYYKGLVDDVVTHEITAGEWYNKDIFFFEAAEDTTQALTDWRHPFTRMAHTEKYYSGAFTANVGWKGNGASSATTGFRINLMYNPGDGGTYNFKQNNNSFGYYSGTHNNEVKVDMSALNASSVGSELYSHGSTFSISAKDCESTDASVINFTNIGFISCQRTASNAFEISKDGYDSYQGGAKPTTASQAIASVTMYEFCRTVNGTKSSFSSKVHEYITAGAKGNTFLSNSIVEQYALIPLGIAPTTRIIFDGNSMIAQGYIPQYVLLSIGYNFDVLVRGVGGKTNSYLNNDARTTVFNKQKSYLSHEFIFLFENTNTMAGNSSNATTTYNDLVAWCDSTRVYFPNDTISVGTMLPRNAAQVNNAHRQNDSNLNDTTTLNGMIRVKIIRDKHCNRVCDVASDTLMGKTGQQTNTVYYSTDQIHPTSTITTGGYKRVSDNYITQSIQAGL